MSPRAILLTLSTSRYSRHLVQTALDEARRFKQAGEAVEIDVLYVIEEMALTEVSRKMGNAGFLGLSFQSDVMRLLGDEHHRMALRRVGEIQQQAGELNVPVHVGEVSGDFEAQLVEKAASRHYDIILISGTERPFISRLLFGSEDERVARLFREENLGRLIIDVV